VGAEAKPPFEAGVTVLPQGFREVSRFPDPGKLGRARALVLELGIPIPVDSWSSLATLCDTPWLSASRHITPASARILRRRLRLLAAAPQTMAAAAAAVGAAHPVHLRGVCQPLLGPADAAPIWRVETASDEEGRRWLIEEGRDFVLVMADGGYAQVVSAAGHFAGLGTLGGGEEVSVFGYADEASDLGGYRRGPGGRGGLVLTLRSGSELPLLVAGRHRDVRGGVVR
jgi:hypothetical protein